MNTSTSMSAAVGRGASAAPTRARFGILALLATGTMINYLDRTVLGIAAPSLSKDLGLSPAMMGLVFSAFAWTYAAAQIPGASFSTASATSSRTSCRWSSGRSSRCCRALPPACTA